jgi:hypothetical protein
MSSSYLRDFNIVFSSIPATYFGRWPGVKPFESAVAQELNLTEVQEIRENHEP